MFLFLYCLRGGEEIEYDLSKTTKLLKLNSLLQEVCIKAVLFSYNPSLFRTNESPLIPKYVLLIPNTLLQYGPCNVGN